MALVGEPDACLDQAESYTTPSRGIEGKADGSVLPIHPPTTTFY